MSYPMGPPPVGGDQNRGPALRDVTIVSFTLVVLALVLRMYSRRFLVRQVGWDDYTIIAATAFAAINTSFVLLHVANGGGRHAYYLDRQRATEQQKWSTLAQMPLIFSTTLTKISICLLIIRIANNRRLIRFMYGLIGALIVVNGACFIELLAQCRPIVSFWDFSVPGQCFSHDVLYSFAWIQGGFSIITDLICCTLPVIVLWNIKISRSQKIAICGLIGLGLFTTGCCVARMYLYGIATDFRDSSYAFAPLEIATVLEQNIGLIVASMPSIRPAFKLAMEKSAGSINAFKSLLDLNSNGGSAGTRKTNGNSKTHGAKFSAHKYPSEDSGYKSKMTGLSTVDDMVLPLHQLPPDTPPEDYVNARVGDNVHPGSAWARTDVSEGRHYNVDRHYGSDRHYGVEDRV